jgi:hypothetical protein
MRQPAPAQAGGAMPAVGGRGVGRKAERGGRLTHADAVGAPVKGWAAAALPEWWPAQAFWNPQDVASTPEEDGRGDHSRRH